jgi:hypothetical protein
MSLNFLRFVISLFGWAAALGLSLSLSNWTSDWSHGVCGPWGCGPPIPALLACHLSWFILLLPIAVQGARWLPPKRVSLLGWIAMAGSTISIAAMATYERMTWYAQASELNRPYFWNRVGFTMITQVDLPVLQVFTVGFVFVVASQRFLRPSDSKLPT